jgi:hypothetical protein
MAMSSVDEVLVAAEERVEMPSERLRQALENLTGLSDQERQEVHLTIARALPTVKSPAGAGILALWVGAAVEKGVDPGISAGFVQEALFGWLRSLSEPPEDDGEASPSVRLSADLLDGIGMLETSLVAHLSRCEPALVAFRNHTETRTLLERCCDWEAGGAYLREILNQCSGELVVLHGSELKGYRLSYRNLSNCFHLFTLLQGALEGQMPGSLKASREALEIARGRESGDVTDVAWWHYGKPSLPEANLRALVYGEGSPKSIESVDGVQVLLVWPPVMENRSWNAGFFYPRLQVAPPEVTIERELFPEEITKWRSRLGLSRAPNPERAQEVRKKPWWKIF